jgi:UPF0755 protein
MIRLLTKKYKRYILYLQIIIVLLSLPFIYNLLPIHSKIKTFYLSSSIPKDIAKTLEKHGYWVTPIDKMMLTLKEIPQIGWYTVQEKESGRFSFFTNLYKMKTDALMNVVIYAGETKEEISHRLANDMKLNEKKLLQHYDSLSRFKEGDILASSYSLARKAEENATMQYLFYTSSIQMQQFEDNNISIGHKIRTLRELLIIASIIQKESNSISEMPFIATVIHNRLNKNMYLQMDATLNYGPYAHTIVSRDRIRNENSLYNTYKHKGLPPHPLSSVTLDALHSTIHPKSTAYLFFMLTPTGAHTFSETYTEHLEKVASFRQYQAERRRIKAQENNESNTSSFGFKRFKKFKI